MNLQLDGKKVLVTGSSKGIGEAIARKFASENAVVIVHGRNHAQSEKVANDIVAQGGKAFFVTGDLTDDQQVQRLVEEAEKLAGVIDILVNNAGGSGDAKVGWSETQTDPWTYTYDRNVLAAVRVITRLLPKMQQGKWGRVINISSIAAIMPPPSSPDYAASKSAMNAMTVSMAKAVAADGVTVNAVSPGTIHSSKLESRFREVAAERNLINQDAPWEDIERVVLPLFAQVPVGRVGQLDDIANAVAFLASPLAGYISGINLRVDGAMSSGL